MCAHLVGPSLLQAAHELFHCAVYGVVLLEVVFYGGEVGAPLGTLQKVLDSREQKNNYSLIPLECLQRLCCHGNIHVLFF